MTDSDGSRRKCYTFIWKLENVRYCWHKIGKSVISPAFVVDEIAQSKWRLALFPRDRQNGTIVGLYLLRKIDNHTVNVKIDSEIAFLEFNGAVLMSGSCKNKTFGHENRQFLCSGKREDVFPEGKSSFNFRETFTARCKIWKSEGELTKDVQCIARTRISVQKTSFLWQIENFSALAVGKKCEYELKSLKDDHDDQIMMTLSLSIKRDQKINIVVHPENQEMKFFTFDLSVIDGSGDTIESLRDERWSNEPGQIEQKSLNLSKTKLTEKKNIYLPNDVLSLKCRCVMSFGIASNEIEGISYDCTAYEKDEMRTVSDEEHIVSVSKDVLNESLKSLLNHENESPLFKRMVDNLMEIVNNGTLSDIKLRTPSSRRFYIANMFILSARSPVFKDMLSGEVNHRMKDYFYIEDLEDDTLSRILQYIYRSQVEQLDWSSAIKLYAGADKFKILDLKVKCSSYLKTNLSKDNACEALELAHLHKDEDLKDGVQRFILKHPTAITNSEEWGKLLETNPKLAAETLSFKYTSKYKEPHNKSGEKQEKPSGNQKRKREEDSKKHSQPITKYFKESKNVLANSVPSCSSSTHLPLEVSKEPGSQRKVETVLIQESPSSSLELLEASEE